jgi:hypothetical protein
MTDGSSGGSSWRFEINRTHVLSPRPHGRKVSAFLWGLELENIPLMTAALVAARIQNILGDLMRAGVLSFLICICLLGCSSLRVNDQNSKRRSPGSLETSMKYSKISGTFLNFQNGQRINTGISYSSQEFRSDQKELIIKTYENSKVIETHLILKGPKYLEFISRTDDPRIPAITGEFFNSEYEECILKSALPDKKIDIDGVVTKVDLKHALSTKALTDSSGKITGIMQEQVELISESDFKSAIDLK